MVSYTDQGKGATVVLLHGFLENKTMWHFFISSFIKKNRVITIDLLGFGKTQCIGYVHTMEDQADVVAAVLHDLKIRKAIFVGHSMGGYVALAVAELYPEMMKGLVLLNSTSRADNDQRKTNRNRAIQAVKQNYTSAVSMSIANLFSEKNRTKLIDEIELVKKEALKTPLQGVIAALEGMKIRKDREIILHFAQYPVLLILGRQDPVLNYDENKDQIEDTKTQLITLNDGHMSPIENTFEVQNILLDFFKKR